MTVRCGLIGYGRWGAWHAAAIKNAPYGELAGIAVSTPESARRAGSEQGVPVYTDYRELLARPDIDAADIVLPNYLHYEAAMYALGEDKHLLLEKPLALTVEQGRAIAAEAERRGLVVQVGHELRFSPLWGKVREHIVEGRVGTLKSVSIHLSRRPFRPGTDGWRLDAERVGSWTLEEPVHYYDLLRWYFADREEPAVVYAAGNSRQAGLEALGLYENLHTTVVFSAGGIGVFGQTLAAYEHHLQAEIVGTSGVLKLWWSGATDEVREPRYHMEYFDGMYKHPIEVAHTPGEVYELNRQLDLFTESVRSGGKPAVSAEDGWQAVRLGLAAQQSAVSGRPVDLRSIF